MGYISSFQCITNFNNLTSHTIAKKGIASHFDNNYLFGGTPQHWFYGDFHMSETRIIEGISYGNCRNTIIESFSHKAFQMPYTGNAMPETLCSFLQFFWLHYGQHCICHNLITASSLTLMNGVINSYIETFIYSTAL